MDGKVTENGIKGDTSMEKVSKLAPAFIKPHGKQMMVIGVCGSTALDTSIL